MPGLRSNESLRAESSRTWNIYKSWKTLPALDIFALKHLHISSIPIQATSSGMKWTSEKNTHNVVFSGCKPINHTEVHNSTWKRNYFSNDFKITWLVSGLIEHFKRKAEAKCCLEGKQLIKDWLKQRIEYCDELPYHTERVHDKRILLSPVDLCFCQGH